MEKEEGGEGYREMRSEFNKMCEKEKKVESMKWRKQQERQGQKARFGKW